MTDITDVREALSDCREEADRAWAIVDLQSKELDAHQAERMALFTEVDRLRADVTQAYRDRADGRASERARIVEAVRGLHVGTRDHKDDNDWMRGFRQSRNETVDAILALLEGDR